MYSVTEAYYDCEQIYSTEGIFAVDGGYLLRCVVWPQHGTYSDVYKAYISYVEKHFHRNCYVIFDGYSDGPSTKELEQSQRAKKVQSTEMLFTDEMPVTMRQDRFLANGKNKARLINGLKVHLEQAGISTKEAAAVADTLIVQTAIELSQNKDVVVVGTDTNLLILLIQLCQEDNRLYLFKHGSGTQPNKVYNIRQVQHSLTAGSCSNLFFLHAMTGCDTTSALYRQGKKKAFKLLLRCPELKTCVEVFNDPSLSESDVKWAGEEFLLALYGAPKTTPSLNEYIYYCFMKAVVKCPIHTQFQLSSLPPTSAAAKEHSLCVYHRVQHWLGCDLLPSDWGWNLVHGELHPVLTHKSPTPDYLLNLISCKCKAGCERGCGCRKADI